MLKTNQNNLTVGLKYETHQKTTITVSCGWIGRLYSILLLYAIYTYIVNKTFHVV